MTRSIIPQQTFEDFKVSFNKLQVQDLFQKYEEMGFIYAAKKALLAPHWQEISQNWEKLRECGEDFLWILGNDQDKSSNFASVTAWKQSNYGMHAQHLVSNGNPFLSLRVMLAAQYKAEHHYGQDEVRSSQNWFRPNNRYAYRVFASMYEKLGARKAGLRLFQYYKLKLAHIRPIIDSRYEAEEVRNIDPEFIAFVEKQYGYAFVKAEELDEEDICLEKMDRTFQKKGLRRYRKVFKLREKRTGKIKAALIINRAPLGINFSFLENRAYYILDKDMPLNEKNEVLVEMNFHAKAHYEDISIGAIPIVTDPEHATAIQKQDAVLIREYMQSIWLREGFSQWFEHIDSFLRKIESRLNHEMKPGKVAS
ncbi:MAG: hypothetical protein AAF696_13040 [Bacteroidota bacterium]